MATNFGHLYAKEMHGRGYSPAKILLNGNAVTGGVTEMNDIEGWIGVYDLENGNIVVNDTGDGAKVKRLYGEVDFLPNQGEWSIR